MTARQAKGVTQRGLVLAALGLAALSQAAFLAAYAYSTNDCFCAALTSAPSPPPFITRTVLLGSLPLRAMPVYFEWPILPRVGDAEAAVAFARINAAFWAIGLLALLNAIALPFRLRRGMRIAALSAVPVHRLVTACLLLLGGSLAGGAWMRSRWLQSADESIRIAIQMMRSGQTSGEDGKLEVVCYYDCTSEQFDGSYVVLRDEESIGTHPLDRVVTPTHLTGQAHFASGARVDLYVSHVDGRWSVLVDPKRCRFARGGCTPGPIQPDVGESSEVSR